MQTSIASSEQPRSLHELLAVFDALQRKELVERHLHVTARGSGFLAPFLSAVGWNDILNGWGLEHGMLEWCSGRVLRRIA